MPALSTPPSSDLGQDESDGNSAPIILANGGKILLRRSKRLRQKAEGDFFTKPDYQRSPKTSFVVTL